MLIIEVDGEHHLSADGKQHDETRDSFLRERGYRVLRIAGYDVIRNLSGVIELMEKAIDARVEELGNATR